MGDESSTWECALAQRGTSNIELTFCFLDTMYPVNKIYYR